MLCRDLHAATGGAFDPTSTPLSREWGFLARQGRLPSEEAIAAYEKPARYSEYSANKGGAGFTVDAIVNYIYAGI